MWILYFCPLGLLKSECPALCHICSVLLSLKGALKNCKVYKSVFELGSWMFLAGQELIP